MSTRCITCPPSSFPSAFVCAGNTTSDISDREALTGFPGKLAFSVIIFSCCIIQAAMPEPKKTRRQLLEEFLAKKPDDAFSRYGLAVECSNTGDTAAADQHFKTLTAQHPDYIPAYLMYAQML